MPGPSGCRSCLWHALLMRPAGRRCRAQQHAHGRTAAACSRLYKNRPDLKRGFFSRNNDVVFDDKTLYNTNKLEHFNWRLQSLQYRNSNMFVLFS
ncbi:hypothetical protein PVAP13_1NG501319 [Panicum virgatum]|uniref:Uncharacterized protein n=1 Tax=Panicum virgatum TaxID=38727 RepID=A0A8T0XA27_PANVG|nr:hypothetical protein PVAP13_1NG501319 [Panicum virgatum]